MNTVAERLLALREHIAERCTQVGRPADAVALVAVSKTQPQERVDQAWQAGQLDFGENRPQELVLRHQALPQAHWHQIGQLQRNKVKSIVGAVALIHVLDSVRLLEEIEKRAADLGRVVRCLIQVNISDEDQKAGTDAAGAHELIEALAQCPHVRIEGLMGIAEDTDDRARIGRQFARLRKLSEDLAPLASERFAPSHLSMGMSSDYEIAIAEGSTLVRIGSAIFGSRA